MRRLYAEREVTHGPRLDDAMRVTDQRRTLSAAQGEGSRYHEQRDQTKAQM